MDATRRRLSGRQCSFTAPFHSHKIGIPVSGVVYGHWRMSNIFLQDQWNTAVLALAIDNENAANQTFNLSVRQLAHLYVKENNNQKTLKNKLKSKNRIGILTRTWLMTAKLSRVRTWFVLRVSSYKLSIIFHLMNEVKIWKFIPLDRTAEERMNKWMTIAVMYAT